MGKGFTGWMLLWGVTLASGFSASAESVPSGLDPFLNAGKVPRYIRISAKGYQTRTSPDFAKATTNNLGPLSEGGELLAVKGVIRYEYGTAVEARTKTGSIWVWVPKGEKKAFEFCETQACFASLAEALEKFAHGSGVTVEQAEACGVVADAQGLALSPDAAWRLSEQGAPQSGLSKPFKMSVRALWEVSKPGRGEMLTKLLSDSLDRYGKNLLNQRTLADAGTFCPNYSRLSRDQRKEFWMHLFNGVALRESSFTLGPPVFDEEEKKQVFRGPLDPQHYSMGLFALSYQAATNPNYKGGGCHMNLGRDRYKDITDLSLTIYDAKVQTDCAVTIMNTWVPKDGAIGLSVRGGARFWSTLRTSNPATASVIQSMKRFSPCWKAGGSK
ncbi:MAG TPA: hypothetical protein VIH99_14200 [Bdellovibrionota bacterium]|jgi:hypothetical protein